jgi:hypothetical protein
VASLDEGRRLFGGILGGTESGSGREAGSEWVDLEWDDDGRIRLLHPTDPDSALAQWLRGRPGGIRHLDIVVDEPERVAGAVEQSDGVWEIAPEGNFGVRLLLSSPLS